MHRDFKPDNVLIGHDGRVRVTDFGVAQAVQPSAGVSSPPHPLPRTWLEPITESGKLMGTPRYMAPEQLQGQPVDARSDLFAFCVALYEALYAVSPFAGDTFTELLQARSADHIAPQPSRSKVPAWLGRAVLRGMRADPLQRQGSMEALLEELRHEPARRRWRRVRGAALAAGGALLLTASVWGWGREAAVPPSRDAAARARALYWTSQLRDRAGDYPGSEAAAREALVLAAQEKDAALEAQLWNLLVISIGARQGRHAEALVLELPLTTAAQRTGDALHLALALETLGTVHWKWGELELSRQHYARALALMEKARGAEELDVARLRGRLDSALMELGRPGEASANPSLGVRP